MVLLFVKFRIECVEVACVEVLLRDAERFTESLEVHNFSCAQKLDWITYFRIFN